MVTAKAAGLLTQTAGLPRIPQTTDKPIIASLTGLRFFAAMAVVLYHYSWLIPYPPAIFAFVRQGWAGVGLFFVLSGFVITYNYADWFATDTASYWTFLRARFARVVPLHVVALALATPISLYAMYLHSISFNWTTALSWLTNLFLLEAYVPITQFKVWNAPAWSISVEFFYYLTFPFIARRLFVRFDSERSLEFLGLGVIVTGALFIGPVSYFLTSILGQFPPELGVEPGYALHRFPPVRMGEFLLGCTLALAFLRARSLKERGLMSALRRNRAVREMMVAFAVGLFGLVSLTSQNAEYTSESNMIYMVTAAMLIGALASGPTLLSPILEHRAVVLLGNASYSLYMIHWIPVAATALLVGARPSPAIDPYWSAIAGANAPGMLAVALLLVSTVLISIACYRLVESPARRLLRPKSRPRQPACGAGRIDGSQSGAAFFGSGDHAKDPSASADGTLEELTCWCRRFCQP